MPCPSRLCVLLIQLRGAVHSDIRITGNSKVRPKGNNGQPSWRETFQAPPQLGQAGHLLSTRGSVHLGVAMAHVARTRA